MYIYNTIKKYRKSGGAVRQTRACIRLC